MKKVDGQFIGKIKVSLDSKYMHPNNNKINEDIADTERKINMFMHELETVIDMCYERHVNNFHYQETAIDVMKETLREKFIEYNKKL